MKESDEVMQYNQVKVLGGGKNRTHTHTHVYSLESHLRLHFLTPTLWGHQFLYGLEASW